MTTLADKIHDSFDAYYAGKKTGWTSPKAPRPENGWAKNDQARQEQSHAKDAPAESRH